MKNLNIWNRIFFIENIRKNNISQIFSSELCEINKRRRQSSIPKIKEKKDSEISPTVEMKLIGIALSGGGIRSASFSLGVIQALDEYGILKKVDYISAVSGGNYTATFLSSCLNNNEYKLDGNNNPLHRDFGNESSAIKHIRNQTKYLVPGGFLDTIKVPLLWLRGIFVNFLSILPYFILVLIAVIYFFDKDISKALDKSYSGQEDYVYVVLKSLYDFLPYAFLALLVWVTGSALVEKIFISIFNKRKREIYPNKQDDFSHFVQFMIFTIAVSLGWFFFEKQNGRNILTVIAILFVSIPIGIYCSPKNHSYRYYFEHSFGVIFLAIMLCAILKTLPAIFIYFSVNDNIWVVIIAFCALTASAFVIPYVITLFPNNAISKTTSVLVRKSFLYLFSIMPLLLLLLIYYYIGYYFIECKDQLFDPKKSLNIYGITINMFQIFVIMTLIIAILFRWLININYSSLHAFYRDRLCDAYLIKEKGEHEIVRNDQQKLSDLGNDNEGLPYHIINATVNLHGSKNKSLLGRRSDFFIFSKCFCGSNITGYYPTKKLEKLDPNLNLGTAMAISGAAISPNMGAISSKHFVFIMTILNLRIGYWLPNPRIIEKTIFKRFFSFMVSPLGPLYFLREMLGVINENHRYLNLSDAGHIENLGVYQLLQRKCKYIIVVDSEADPELKFPSFANLVSYARIDMGIRIKIDLKDIKVQNGNQFSKKHWALGDIYYENGEQGKILLIKSSLTSDEDIDILQYRQKNPDFPQESTINQLFTDIQFECYRSLGFHIIEDFFANKELRIENFDI